MSTPSSEGLVGALEAPDAAVVFRQWAPTVGRWAHQLSGPGADIDDVVQEVFLRVFEHLPRFRGDCQLSTWLFRITSNVVSNRRRKARWRGWFTGGSDPMQEQAAQVPGPGEGPLEELQRREEVSALYRALDRLRERDRTVIILFEIEGLSGEQIARLMGAKVGTVWTWLHRARAQLMAQMEKGAV